MHPETNNQIIEKLHKIAVLSASEKADALEYTHFAKAEEYHWKEYAAKSVAGWVAANLKGNPAEDIRKVALALTQNNYSLSAENPRHIQLAKVLSLVLEWVIDPEMM